MVVMIITLLIIFYILFLPPEDRAELLGESAGSGGGGGGTTPSPGGPTLQEPGDVIFSVTPGKLEYSSFEGYEYTVPSFTIYQTENAEIFTEAGNFYVKNGWFEKKEKSVDFRLEDIDKLSNLQLTATLSEHKGTLTITLNGRVIYDYGTDQGNIGPIELPMANLHEGTNTLTFSVSEVGLAFWTTNQYRIDSMKVTGKRLDTSRSSSRTSFYIPPDEAEDMETAKVKFYPDCTPSDVGTLTVHLNTHQVFNGIPDCGILNSHSVSPSALNLGENQLMFSTEKGRYLIDQISVDTQLKEREDPTYYFDLSRDLFEEEKEEYDRCGEIDDYCPDDCDADLDKDCCFEEYQDGFWCDVKTDYIDDRCVGRVEEDTCGRCRAGYEDDDGDIAPACEKTCGDDDDDTCPVGCDGRYDKDCCFSRSGDQYWCDDLPITGSDFICVDSVTYDSCAYCESGYDGEDRDPSCDLDRHEKDGEDVLREDYHIEVVFKFTEKGATKEALFFVNGHESGFDTRSDEYTKRIDDDIEPGSNSLRLEPKSDLDMREIQVRIEE